MNIDGHCLCGKIGFSLPSYATNFSVKRYDDLQLMQKLRAANKGIFLDDAK